MELSFSSSRKMMSTLHNIGGENIVFCKGAVEIILNKAKFLKTPKSIKIIDKTDRDNILKDIELLSKKGFRVIAFAYRDGIYKNTITEADIDDSKVSFAYQEVIPKWD
jgi:Ca2+-transporting ATPase